MSNSSDWKEPTGKKSEVWKHVLVKSGDDSVVKCKYCSARFNPKQATTSLIYPLQNKEGINLKKSSEPKEVNAKLKKTADNPFMHAKKRFSRDCSCKTVGC